MDRRLFAVLVLVACAFAPRLEAQHAVGVRAVAWPNPVPQLQPLAASVHYPASSSGVGAPLLRRADGWPTVVFLHGFGKRASDYAALGDEWARAGFVVIVSDTSIWDTHGQERDGRALFAAALAANEAGPFAGAFDTKAFALAGHSMGGGNVANVLANNPGYRCGFALAPVLPRAGNGALVDVPLGIAVGQFDPLTPPPTTSFPYYQSLSGYRHVKFLHVLGSRCNHDNIGGLALQAPPDHVVFAEVSRLGLSFLRRFLIDHPSSLDAVLGAAARTGVNFVSLAQEYESPEVWLGDRVRIGHRVRLSMAGEPGIAGVLAAFRTLPAPVSTPIGQLFLDPASAMIGPYGATGWERRHDFLMQVPSDPGLVGFRFHVQAVGTGRGGGLRLGNTIPIEIER